MRFDLLLKRYFAVVVLSLVGIGAYFQASGVTQFVGTRLAVSASDLSRKPPGPAVSGLNDPKKPSFHSTDGTPILARNPFDSVTGPLLDEDPGSGEPVERKVVDFSNPYSAPQCTDQTRVLIIAAAEDPAWSMAALSGEGTGGKVQMRRTGDTVGSKKLWYVAWDRVWLQGNGDLCQVQMFQDKKAAAPKSSAAKPPPKPPPGKKKKGPRTVPPEIASKIQKVSETEFNVDRSVVDTILENQAELMRSARIVPERKDGKVVGIRLFRVRPDTLLGTLGLKNGDRLESINGFDITSPEKALEAYARLRTAGHLTIAVNRGGKPTNIDFNIK